MQPLYETDSIWTLDEYLKFNYTVADKQLKRMRNAYYILTAYMFVLGVLMVAVPIFPTSFGIILLVFSILNLCAYHFKKSGNFDKSIKSAWESDKTIKDVVSHISFYEDRLVSRNAHSTERVQYSEIFKIIENDTDFYIMLSEIKGINIIKANCSRELIDYIRGLGNKGIGMEARE